MNTTAQVAKTYTDGTFDIVTLPVADARIHVAARTAAPAHFGLARITVRVGTDTHSWAEGKGWDRPAVGTCDMAAVEHPGFPCAHPAK